MNTLFIGQNTIKLDAVGSTNDYASELLSRGLKREKVFEGTVVYALSQRAGKGQRGKKWESEPFKNLTFSIVFYPSFLSAQEQFMLSKAVSLGICDYVSSVINKEAKIKWPNDIKVGNEKIAGILIENSIRNNEIMHSIVGIGLNVNQTGFGKNIPNPTSLKLITGKNIDLEVCLGDLCSYLEARYLQLKSGKSKKINEDYEKSAVHSQQPADDV